MPPAFVMLVILASVAKLHAVKINPDLPPRSVQYNASGTLTGINELPLGYISEDGKLSLVKAPGCAPQQVSVAYYGADSYGKLSVLVSWATCNSVMDTPAAMGSCKGSSDNGIVTKALSTQGITSVVYWGPKYANKLVKTATGTPTSYVQSYAPWEGYIYASPLLHHVLITGLLPGQEYKYVIVDNVESASQTISRMRRLKRGRYGPMPFVGIVKVPGAVLNQSPYPLKVGVIGDPGQTYNTSDTLRHLMASNSDLIFILGDLSYADRSDIAGVAPLTCNTTTVSTYPPRWDTVARLFQPLLSAVPVLTVTGNHEIEPMPRPTSTPTNVNGRNAAYSLPYNTNFSSRCLSYSARWPVPQSGPTAAPRPEQLSGATPQPGAPLSKNAIGSPLPGAYTNQYYKAEVPGVFTSIWLSSYSPYDIYAFTQTSEQLQWLRKQLKMVDRNKTPWLIVSWHAPWYNSYTNHFKENECFRQAVEDLLMKYSVDLVFTGHVHAYERSKPVYNYTVDPTGCAPMHITIGDGGNIEGMANNFSSAQNCPQPNFPDYQPQSCVLYNQGPGSGCPNNTTPCFCYTQQPAWSAFREPSFGHGELLIESPTTAKWTWYRNQDKLPVVSDEVTITRLPKCSQKG